ncbi:hypothetical protein PG987_001205 [Apiospora arundinis]
MLRIGSMGKAVGVASYATELGSAATQVTTFEAQPEVLFQVALRTVSKVAALDLFAFVLLQKKDMLTGRHFLLPSLDLLFARKGVGLHDTIDYGRDLGIEQINVDLALQALGSGMVVVSVGFGLGGDGELGHLGRRFILSNLLPSTTNVEGQRVAPGGIVDERMQPHAGATTVEALQANVEASSVIL